MGRFLKITEYLESNKAVSAWLLFLICFSFFFYLQLTPSFGDPDSFYHIKIARMMGEGGVVRDFPYLPFTVLKDNYIDHHLLYHLFLVPFVGFLPPLAGAKLAHIILDTLVILVFYQALKRFKVKGAFWYALFLLLSQPFIFRLSLVKAQPFSLIILFLGIYLIASRRYLWLALLSFFYVWSYGGWPLMLFLVLLFVLADSFVFSLDALKQGWLGWFLFKIGFSKTIKATRFFLWSWAVNFFRKENIKLILSVVVGLGSGLIINPYFPQNLDFYWFQVIQIAFVNYQGVIGVGAEWYPYSVPDFFKSIALPLILVIPALFCYISRFRKFGSSIHFAFLIFLLFLVMTIRARRNIEYFVPFAVFFSALVFAAASRLKIESAKWRKFLTRWFDSDPLAKIFLIAVVISLFFSLGIDALVKNHEYLENGIPFDRLAKAAAYIKQISQEGDIVFHSDWDDFPALFFYNDQNYYIVGLDPTFMYLKNQDLYFKWRDITLGRRAGDMYGIIKDKFKAKYVLVNRENGEFAKNLKNNFFFKEIYADEQALIFQVL